MSAKRVFSPNEQYGVVDAMVDSIDDHTAHGTITGALSELPAMTMLPATLHVRVVF